MDDKLIEELLCDFSVKIIFQSDENEDEFLTITAFKKTLRSFVDDQSDTAEKVLADLEDSMESKTLKAHYDKRNNIPTAVVLQILNW